MLRWHIEKGAAATVGDLEVPVAGSARRFGVDPGRRGGARRRLPGEAGASPSRFPAAAAWRSPRWASTSSRPTCSSRRSRRTPARARQATTSARTSCRRSSATRRCTRTGSHDENKKAGKYWRDIGDARRLLRGQHGPRARSTRSSTCTTRSGRCAPIAAGAAGEVRVRRRGPALRPGARLDHLGRRASSRAAASAAACSAPTSASTASATSTSSILMPGVRVGRHARIRNAIIDRDVFIPRGAVHRPQPRRRSQAPHGDRQGRRRGHHRRRAADPSTPEHAVLRASKRRWDSAAAASNPRLSGLRTCRQASFRQGRIREDQVHHRPRDSRLARQSHGRSRRHARRRRVRPRGSALGRVHR